MGQEERPIRFSYQAKWISGGLIVVLTIWLLFAVTHILPPFIGAIITAYLFNPLIGWLHRRTRIGRAIWIIVLYIVAFFVLYSLFTALWPRIVQQSRDLAANAPVIIRELTIFFEQNQTIEVGDFVISLAPLEAQVIGLIRDVAGWLSGNVPKIVFFCPGKCDLSVGVSDHYVLSVVAGTPVESLVTESHSCTLPTRNRAPRLSD